MKKFLCLLALTLVGCAAPRVPSATGANEIDVYSRVADSAVGVRTADGTGSGTIIYSDKYHALVLTCAHVVADEQGVFADDVEVVVTRSGRFETVYGAQILQIDVEGDLALLLAGGLGAPAMKVAAEEPRLYTRLYSVASPVGNNNTASAQLLTSKVFVLPFHRGPVWQITGFTMPGSSGGTVADAHGDLTCVIEAGRIMRNGLPIPEMGFCIGLPDIQSFLQGYKL